MNRALISVLLGVLLLVVVPVGLVLAAAALAGGAGPCDPGATTGQSRTAGQSGPDRAVGQGGPGGTAGQADGTGPDAEQPTNTRTTVDCDGDGTDGPAPGIGHSGLPAGYRLPTDAQARTAVAFALEQLGEPYVFAANGPDSWDCSSLVQQAWAAAGVTIPRVTYQQVSTGVAVPGLSAARPGDLLFIPGSLGSPANPRHVGMYIGTDDDGTPYLVQAPHSGDVVKVSPVSAWAGQIVAIRRPTARPGGGGR